MDFNPFEILGTWKLISENSSELLKFNPDGTYYIYYEIPFRLIELGEWQILKNKLILFYGNSKISCKINCLKDKRMEFVHLSETQKIIKDNYKRIN
jgi:hypothetical protein